MRAGSTSHRYPVGNSSQKLHRIAGRYHHHLGRKDLQPATNPHSKVGVCSTSHRDPTGNVQVNKGLKLATRELQLVTTPIDHSTATKSLLRMQV